MMFRAYSSDSDSSTDSSDNGGSNDMMAPATYEYYDADEINSGIQDKLLEA